MHMSDALLSPVVGGVMCALSTGAIGYSIKKIKKDEFTEKKIPIMGVMGAFVFAAQMINFTIPGTGSSGHIGGGILLAAAIGGFPALLSLSAVLLIQCLFFADGGLLALGSNIFNMAVIPCLLIYPLIFKPLIKKGMNAKRLTVASILSVVAGLQLGAFGVVIETTLSGITELPFAAFTALMQPIHLAIGLIEGIITAAVLCFVYKMRPEILESANSSKPLEKTTSTRKVLTVLAVLTLLVGGGLSIYASSNPDGLEWSIIKLHEEELEAEGAVIEGAAKVQDAAAFMPDYSFKNSSEDGSALGTSAAGIIGGLISFLLAAVCAFVITLIKKSRKTKNEINV